MHEIPRNRWPNSTLALKADPYQYISNQCRHYGTDLFETRLMLRKTICMTGPEAAALFYDESRFIRAGAAPGWLKKTLLGKGGVQGLDGEAHRHRKQMFMSLMTQERIGQLVAITDGWWRIYAQKWAGMDHVALYGEVNEILSRAVCEWAGIQLHEAEADKRTKELMAMFDRAATLSPAHLWSRLARRRAERWIADIIDHIRAGKLKPPQESAAWVIAMHRDLNGDLLNRRIAAVELINVLRPTVAVSVFIIFTALALHHYPECREKLQQGEPGYADLFAQEVRRFYPFFPAVMARTRQDFEWKGYHFPKDRKVALDLYGTNHDSRSWEEPEAFQPERFLRWDGSPFNFIPQGGGTHHQHHRCPGEMIAVELIKAAAGFLAKNISYNVPEQDLRIDWARLPALPRSRFTIRNVRMSA